ncbi:hypothetical protein J3R83DRAFT_2982 [Lanmaoa asiatica]|nr:hypothetical protein J3R83DRAFT_2982 [Lanmaoa asiatica]
MPAHVDPAAWAVLLEFASTDMGLPEAEKCLQNVLGARYVEADWQSAFKAVMDAKNDSGIALTTIARLENSAINQTGLKIRIPACSTIVSQLTSVETDVSQSILELQGRNRIFGTPLTLNEFLEPKEEAENLDSITDILEGGDEAIVAKVVQEMSAEVIDVDKSEDDGDVPNISRADTIDLCEKLADACLQHGDTNTNLTIGLLSHLRHFRVLLHQEELIHARQTTLDHFFTPQSRRSPGPSA